MIRSTTIKALVVLALTVIHARILSPPSPHHRLVDTQAMITAVLKTVHEQKFTAGDGLNGDQFEHAVNTTLLSVSNLIDKAKLESVACCARMNLALEGLAKSVSDDKSADRTTVKMLYDEIAMIRRGEMEIMGHFHLLESTGVAAKLKWKERKGISKAKQDFHNNFVEQTCTLTKRLDVIANRVKTEPEPKQPSRDSIGLEMLRVLKTVSQSQLEIKRDFKYRFDDHRQETNRRFDETNRRFDDTNRRYGQSQDEIKRDFKSRFLDFKLCFDDHRQETNRCFDEHRQETNRHVANIRRDIKEGFDGQRRYTDKSIKDLYERWKNEGALDVIFKIIGVGLRNFLQFVWSIISQLTATVKHWLGFSHSPKRFGAKRK